jgi:sec-independent protein translocase protein TatA
MSLGPVEIGLIVLAVMLLFGYKKLPDASRALGRSLRIFKSEVDDLRTPAPSRPYPSLPGVQRRDRIPQPGAAGSSGP